VKEGVFKGVFFQNILLKIMALAFAVALWFLVTGEKRTEISFWIPLEFKNLPENMMVVGEPVREIEVRLLVSKKMLKDISPAQLTASIDLSNVKTGHNNLRVGHSDVKVPKNVEVININPSSIIVHLEPIYRTDDAGQNRKR
jgi:hypothetical protein